LISGICFGLRESISAAGMPESYYNKSKTNNCITKRITNYSSIETLGKWPEREDVRVKGPAKMGLSGPAGEPI